MKEYESKVDWSKILFDVKFLFTKLDAKYYIKNDLFAYDVSIKVESCHQLGF